MSNIEKRTKATRQASAARTTAKFNEAVYDMERQQKVARRVSKRIETLADLLQDSDRLLTREQAMSAASVRINARLKPVYRTETIKQIVDRLQRETKVYGVTHGVVRPLTSEQINILDGLNTWT